MDIKKRLESWKASTEDGEYETLSTITIKTKSMSVSVSGGSLEQAFAQLEGICKEKEVSANKAEPTFPETTPTMVEAKTLADAMNGRNLVRIHNANIPLAPNEELMSFNGTTWVVTGGVK